MNQAVIRCLHLRTLADTFAMVTFAFVVGMFVETILSGLTLNQSFQSRILAIPLNFIVARPYGMYRDWLFSLGGRIRGRFAKILLDILAFLSFILPQYAVVLWWVGAEFYQIVTACVTLASMSLAIGRPYGLYMVFCRRLFERKFSREGLRIP